MGQKILVRQINDKFLTLVESTSEDIRMHAEKPTIAVLILSKNCQNSEVIFNVKDI